MLNRRDTFQRNRPVVQFQRGWCARGYVNVSPIFLQDDPIESLYYEEIKNDSLQKIEKER